MYLESVNDEASVADMENMPLVSRAANGCGMSPSPVHCPPVEPLTFTYSSSNVIVKLHLVVNLTVTDLRVRVR